jgi:uncharacterized membrane protein YqaE (UPF0057 family)
VVDKAAPDRGGAVGVAQGPRAPTEEEGRALREGVSVDFLRIVVALLLPPLGVFLQVGLGKQFWINILLTLLGYVPGIVHAVWVIARY